MGWNHIANRIAELHYPNEPNVINDQKYRLIRMKTLADQVESELNLLTTPGQSEQLIEYKYIKIEIENLRAYMQGWELNIHQKADAIKEFNKLIDYVIELEKKQ